MIDKILTTIFISLVLWTAFTSIYAAFKFPCLTETERFIELPNTFMMDYDRLSCNENNRNK